MEILSNNWVMEKGRVHGTIEKSTYSICLLMLRKKGGSRPMSSILKVVIFTLHVIDSVGKKVVIISSLKPTWLGFL